MELLMTFLVSGSAAAVVSWVLKRIDKKLDKRDAKDDTVIALQRAIQALMYDRIKHIAKTYIDRGWCSVEEYEDLRKLHESYHNDTKGNGFLDDIMRDVKGLPRKQAV